MIVAIATFGSRVSPRFDCCETFLILELDEQGRQSRKQLFVGTLDTRARIGALEANMVRVLVCGAIDLLSIRRLAKTRISVVPWTSGDIEETIGLLIDGKLEPGTGDYTCCGRRRRKGNSRRKELNMPRGDAAGPGGKGQGTGRGRGGCGGGKGGGGGGGGGKGGGGRGGGGGGKGRGKGQGKGKGGGGRGGGGGGDRGGGGGRGK